MKKLLIALALIASVAHAGEVKELVSPYAPGGVVSSFGRIVQKYLVEEARIDTVLVNKPGADARIGVKYVAGQPDGNRWIVAATGPFLFNQVVYNDPGYKASDFELLVPMAQSPSIIAVSNQSGISTLSEFIARAKTKPMNCGVSNSGALFLTKFLVTQLELSRVEIVSYKGASEVSAALIGGQIECSVDTLQSQLRYHSDNKLKIIAISSVSKNSEVPNAELFSSVIPKFSFYSWYGIGVPKNSPDKETKPVFDALSKINQNPGYQQAIKSIGLELGNPYAKDPQTFIKEQYQRFETIRQKSNIPKVD